MVVVAVGGVRRYRWGRYGHNSLYFCHGTARGRNTGRCFVVRGYRTVLLGIGLGLGLGLVLGLGVGVEVGVGVELARSDHEG